MFKKIKLFSKKKEKATDAAVGIGTGVGVSVLSKKALDTINTKKYIKNLTKEVAQENNGSNVVKGLIDKAKSQGTKVFRGEDPFDAHYDVKKDHIVVPSKGAMSQTETLAHELGHSQYYKGRSGGIIGRISHRTDGLSRTLLDSERKHLGGRISNRGLTSVGSALYGFRSGQKSERLKREGKKENTWNKIKSVALPAAISAPVLISEGLASRKGLKMMKESGASKELLKKARRSMTNAWANYAINGAVPIVSGEAGRLAGKLYEKTKHRKDDK